MLQLPTLALEQRIKTELESNPLLEEGMEEEEDPKNDDEPEVAEEEGGTQEKEEESLTKNSEDDYDWDEFLNSTDDLYGYKAQVDHSEDEEDREMPMPARMSMTEYLSDQLSFLSLSENDSVIADQIIGSIDEDGYLRRPLESIIDDIMFNHGIMLDDDDVERVLKGIQRLDPVGIGSRDLRECLLVQLDMLPEDTPGLEVAQTMLEKAYKPFTMKHFEAILKKVGCTPAELKEAFELVQRLNPKPGEGEFTAAQNYITPDFTVVYVDGEFIISLNNGNAPQLRISRQYRSMLHQISADQKKKKKKKKIEPPSYDTETKQFLRGKLESARWFINSINQRRQTMMKVMRAIVEIQEEFFRFGEGSLKPMILKDVAEKIFMDISTVSRVVNGKYVQTEFGVYELKYFFSEGLTTESGEEVSNKEVKAIIERIIGEEQKKKPLSDQKIAKMLSEQGFQIARRTVTKYREQLGIPVARLRKEIVLS